jgi:TetR/AcrR family tetracycline transcriptional repressor
MRLLDEGGFEAVSLRAVAAGMGVRLNTVTWHIKTKSRLLDLLADAIIGEISLADLPDGPGDAARELLRRYRRALLAHQDGGLVVAGTFAAEPATLRYAEKLLAALLRSGLDNRAAGWTAWTLIYFALGLAQEEQKAPRLLTDQVAPALDAGTYPALSLTMPFLADGAFDDRFEYGLNLILSA